MSSLTLVRRIAARPSIVFEALATEEGITSWWGPEDIPIVSATADVREGGRFRVRFRTLDGREHECAGQFLEVSRPVRIVMSWQWIVSAEPPEEEAIVSRLELSLRPIDTGTELTLVHAGLPNEASAQRHERGWKVSLEKLLRDFSRNSTQPTPDDRDH
jgi:uncharacterized protein YndB with AHSA1/START domain